MVCHDTTDTYKKTPTAAGMPDPAVDLVAVAKKVGKPTRKTCGDCHMSGGGGDGVKHADMSPQLYYPGRSCDVHMGGYDMQCHDCHKTQNHRIWGRSSSVAVAEGSRSCEDCHTASPHYGQQLLDYHLNKHTEHLLCTTCHAPLYSKCQPTKMLWDWSTAGDKERVVEKDKYGLELYDPRKGDFVWKESAKPEYAWTTGLTKRVLLGDPVNLEGETNLTEPVGYFNDPKSRIAPYKVMRGIQMADAQHGYLIVPHLFPRDKDDPTAYWKHFDWQKSFTAGMQAAGFPYSGEYTWVKTNMYWKLNHEIMPKENALSCAQCHDSLKDEKACLRCHQENKEVNFKELARKGTDFETMAAKGRDVVDLIGATDYIDFKKLGYKGDPIIHGGRFKTLPLGFVPVEEEQ